MKILNLVNKLLAFLFGRLFSMILMVSLQIAIIIFAISQTFFYIFPLFYIISFFIILLIVYKDDQPSYKMTWIIAILSLPVVGGVFYLLLGNKRTPSKLTNLVDSTKADISDYLPQNTLREDIRNVHRALQSDYIFNITGYPIWGETQSTYFALGDDMFEKMLEELSLAEKFIFLEFFIIRKGIMWDTVFEILKQKVADGVEIYMMYDDFGCITTLPAGYHKVIRAAGIKLCVFNPFRLRISPILNYRDHKKICLIDGRVVFCGGINLADEYINKLDRFGHWKDTGVMLRGCAVKSFAYMYLQQWQFGTGEKIEFEKYCNAITPVESGELLQVFDDRPLNNFNVTESTYLNIISRATRYVYITTPYLVIDYEMIVALCSSAQSGIDVRIITPFRYDKWYVHTLTRSHYKHLIEAGVKIYEYTPGFIHAKMIVSDDDVCLVGTCNMDFRSFYLHFECSVAFYRSPIIDTVKQDILSTQELCHRVTIEEATNISLPKKALSAFLKIFAPLL